MVENKYMSRTKRRFALPFRYSVAPNVLHVVFSLLFFCLELKPGPIKFLLLAGFRFWIFLQQTSKLNKSKITKIKKKKNRFEYWHIYVPVFFCRGYKGFCLRATSGAKVVKKQDDVKWTGETF